MAHKVSSQRRVKREEKDLNLVPIMNLFIVVIPMLINMWVAYELAMLYMPVQGSPQSQEAYKGGGQNDQDQKTEVTPKKIVMILYRNGFSVRVSDDSNPTLDTLWVNEHNYEELQQKLEGIHQKYTIEETKNSIGIWPDPELPYEVFLKSMEAAKKAKFETITYLTKELRYYARG